MRAKPDQVTYLADRIADDLVDRIEDHVIQRVLTEDEWDELHRVVLAKLTPLIVNLELPE